MQSLKDGKSKPFGDLGDELPRQGAEAPRGGARMSGRLRSRKEAKVVQQRERGESEARRWR